MSACPRGRVRVSEPQYSFTLPESAYRELAILSKNTDHLAKFQEVVANVNDTSNLKVAAQKASEKTGLSTDVTRKVIRALLNLHSLLTHTELEPSDLVEKLTITLETSAPESWKLENLDVWRNAAGPIAEILSNIGPDSTLAVAGKARQVANAHDKSFLDARIYTSLRPVFSSDGDEIHRMIVFNELVLSFLSKGEPQTIQMAMDATDIVELQKQCERAQLKSSVVKRSLSQCDWMTYILNDPEND